MIKEARVECLFGYNLEDLGILLVKGQIQWFDKATYDSSTSLKHAARIGAIDVQWKNRAIAQREAQPPWLRQRGKGPNRKVPIQKPRRNAPTAPIVNSTPLVEMEKIRDEAIAAVRQAASEAARSAVLEVLAKERSSSGITSEQLEMALAKIPTAQTTTPEMQKMVEQLSSIVAKLQNPETRVTTHPSTPETMFIPSGIVTDDKTEIEIKASASSDDGFNVAAEALKKTAPKRRRRKKTSTGDK